jgi:hypothetical protein
MEKNWKKEIFQNLGIIIILGLWAVIGYYLTKDLKLDQEGQTIYFGSNAFSMLFAWFIPGITCIYYIFKELKLLIHLFFTGGTKTKIGCLGIIGCIIILCVGLTIIAFVSIRNYSDQVVNSHQVLVEEYITAANENDYEKMDSFLWIPLQTRDYVEQEKYSKYCRNPTYVNQSRQGAIIFIYMKCENEESDRRFGLIKNESNEYKIAYITIGGNE